MDNATQILPGTGRWQAKPDGGAALSGCLIPRLSCASTGPSTTLRVVPLPVPGRI